MRTGRALLVALCVALGAALGFVLAMRRVEPWIVGAAMLVGLACGLAIGVPAWLTLRGRVLRLTRATRALAQEDFDAPIPSPADDDLGDLQRAWKRMRLAMEELTEGLRGEVARQRSILDGMAEGVALLHDGEIVATNPAFGALLGTAGPLVGKTPLEAARLPELAEMIDESDRLDTEVTREIVAEPRTLRISARSLGGPRRQMVIVLLDMTEARRLERLRRDFVANASHELRTPVAAIVGATETLAAGAADDPEARASFLDILSRHAQRLSRLTSDLLDLARMEGGYRPRAEHVAVGAVVEAVVLALAPHAEEKDITLSFELDDALEIVGERAAIEQVVTNLVDNAVKYTPAGGRVQISGRATPLSVVLAIADTGPGIASEHLPRLFERFYRVDNARSRELGGTGLGLSIVKHLVAAHGGEIRVESEVGRGTRFSVVWPRSRADPASSPESHPALETLH